MTRLMLIVLLALSATLVVTETFFQEKFNDGWEERWVVSDWKKDEGTNGKWGLSHGDFYGDRKEDKGLMTTQDAKFYAISAKSKVFRRILSWTSELTLSAI
jgi:calreticulin